MELNHVGVTHGAVDAKKRDAKKGSRATIAYEEIRRRIVEGVIPPGDPILEDELAADLRISRTPLREALARLRHDGLLTSIHRKGFFVNRLSVDDMREIGEILEALEGMAVRLAAERATPEEVQRLEEFVCAQEEALKRNDIQAWSVADEAFHVTILTAARNRRIQEAVERVRAQWHQRQQLTIRLLRPKPILSPARHRALVEAIKARDSARACDIDRRDRAEVSRVLTDIDRAIGPNR